MEIFDEKLLDFVGVGFLITRIRFTCVPGHVVIVVVSKEQNDFLGGRDTAFEFQDFQEVLHLVGTGNGFFRVEIISQKHESMRGWILKYDIFPNVPAMNIPNKNNHKAVRR